jgi:hypothetical protein
MSYNKVVATLQLVSWLRMKLSFVHEEEEGEDEEEEEEEEKAEEEKEEEEELVK